MEYFKFENYYQCNLRHVFDFKSLSSCLTFQEFTTA
jgi:hypothetical protein